MGTCSEKVARETLEAYNWNVQHAVDGYFNDTMSDQDNGVHAIPINYQELSSIFENYKDPDEDAILVEGTERLCNDLEVDPTDVVMLVVAWHLNAERMCEFKRKGFVDGWAALGFFSKADTPILTYGSSFYRKNMGKPYQRTHGICFWISLKAARTTSAAMTLKVRIPYNHAALVYTNASGMQVPGQFLSMKAARSMSFVEDEARA
ncbi:hypothetical protein K493DRAFT_296167 [Basidiobolus meristosporus CBS 931.73]|uniref:Defective in cullin neddylation protein n=1 Tax=Basidiobolus meristosporus CBS 931.73 TaxID=1314790 RepID=A0A1Y1Z740_9FUNG|nr:hypothetical protein K493DRAFT_296167 [Basidiobolus meristosporus CBS 931.73]|eukprot:ORY06092.1 hypothetical protein K493DRAFT_296167 [Basidiobolus meristosporus CBS 931.73]